MLAAQRRPNVKIIRDLGRVTLRSIPPLRSAYDFLKKHTLGARRALFHLSDAIHTYHHMRWARNIDDYWRLSAEIIFYFHKLEKGLCMPGPKRFFGAQPALTIVTLLDRWKGVGYSVSDPVYLGALECLRAYRARLADTPPPEQIEADLVQKIDCCLEGSSPNLQFLTPRPASRCGGDMHRVLQQLCIARRSVRAFRSVAVNLTDLYESISIAQLSPSACNRQPWHVHVYQERERMRRLLSLQNGNRGFGHQIPMLLIITADANGFFDGSERNQPYIDSGLFTMSLLLALQSRGLASCCLNWCITDLSLDAEAHRLGEIPESERIIMYLAVGYADEGALVPRSVRRDPASFIALH
jgi:nitroreductase